MMTLAQMLAAPPPTQGWAKKQFLGSGPYTPYDYNDTGDQSQAWHAMFGGQQGTLPGPGAPTAMPAQTIGYSDPRQYQDQRATGLVGLGPPNYGYY